VLSATPTTAAYGSVVTLTAALVGQNGVVPTGNVLFYDGTTLLGTANSVNGVAALPVATLAAGMHTLTAQSAGDANYGPATSNAVTETITGTGTGGADYTVTASPSSLTIHQSSLGSSTLTITPVNGYTGTLTLGCTSLPQYATCAFTPTTVTLNGSTPVTVVMAIATGGTAVATTQEPAVPGHARNLPMLAMLPLGLLAGVFCFKRRKLMGATKLLALLLAVAGVMSLSGCVTVNYSGNSANVTPTGTSTVTVTVSPTAGTNSVYHTASVTVTVIQ